jgi:hypothetical protein
MTDHRAVLRARPPGGRMQRIVQTSVDSDTYRRLYDLAAVKEISLRQLIRETLENLVGTR